MLPATAFELLVEGISAAFSRPIAPGGAPARHPGLDRRGTVERNSPPARR